MRSNKLERITIEWARNCDNVGVMCPWGDEQLLEKHMQLKGVLNIINSFWTKETTELSLPDISILVLYWWVDQSIISARTSWLKNPSHHSSECIFDKKDSRLIIKMRQPDLDGKHWKATHIHRLLGKKAPNDCYMVTKTYFNKHTKLARPIIAPAKWFIKIK